MEKIRNPFEMLPLELILEVIFYLPGESIMNLWENYMCIFNFWDECLSFVYSWTFDNLREKV